MTFPSFLEKSGAMKDLPAPVIAPPLGRPLRALVRGTGSIGARHLRVLEAMGVEELFAWPVRSSATLANRVDLPRSVQLIDRYPSEQLDLIVVATDTNRHVSDALEALEQSPVAVLLEKPVAPSAAAAVEITRHPLADLIYVSAPLRFHQGFALMTDTLPALGRITSAQVASQSWLPSWRPDRDFRDSYSARKDDGGALRDLVHDIDYPILLLGAPNEVTAFIGHGVLGIEAEESADIAWQSEATVHLRLDYVSRVKKRGIRIATESAALAWDIVRNEVHLQHPSSGSDTGVKTTSAVFPADADPDMALARQSMAVLELSGALNSNSMSLFRPASLQEGVLTVAICDAARVAAKARRPEKVWL